MIHIRTSAPTIIKELVFLGTGTSSCIPLIGCLMRDKPTCKVCLSAAEGGKNRRLNVSSIVRFQNDGDDVMKNILIDCGKTFYTAARRWSVPMKIGAFEAVLLTHGHADAMFGLDDLRHWTGHGAIQDQVTVYADKTTMDVASQAFPYLVDSGKATGGGFVSDLQFKLIEEPLASMDIGGLEVTPMYVEHGTCSDSTPYMCLAFLFDHGKIAYLSDVSRIPKDAMAKLKSCPPEVLVLDCLREVRPYKSHFILKESIQAVREIKPKRTFFVGMTHDIDHDEFEERIKKLAPDLTINLAYDGLVLKFNKE